MYIHSISTTYTSELKSISVEAGTHQPSQMQNQPHCVRLASCQRSPDRAARVGDECHETLKTGRKCYMNCIYKYMSGIYMVYTWHILMYDESGWWLLTYIGCIPIYILHLCYIHMIYLVYTWHIKGIWTCHPYGRYIPSKVKMGLFRTFFYNYIPVIYHVYPEDIPVICYVFQF